jgi:hypothetical protein
VGIFFRYALGRGRADYIRTAVNISTATDGGIGYEVVLEQSIWDQSVIADQLDKLNREAKRTLS